MLNLRIRSDGRAGSPRGSWLEILMLAPALIAVCGCNSLMKLYPPPPPPSIGALSLIPENLDYGPQKLNTSTRPHLFILTNPPTNDGPAVISEVGTSGPPFEIDTAVSNCAGRTLAVGEHCQIGVKFSPTAPGMQTGSLAITSNAANSPQVGTLEGLGQ